MNIRLVRIFLLALVVMISGCASVAGDQDSMDSSIDPTYQMQHHPVSCLLLHLFNSVANDDLQEFRDCYRWAGPEAAGDLQKLRNLFLFSTMPFSIRLEPLIFQVQGRGEADLRKAEAALSCADNPDKGKTSIREARTILVEGENVRGTIRLFNDGKQYRIIRFEWN